MSDTVRKATATALAVVLLLWAMFPVPSGADAFDRARYHLANANPVIAAEVIVATGMAAAGLMIAGVGIQAYEANRTSIYGDFMNYSGLTVEDLQGSVTASGAIDLSSLASTGFFGFLPSFAQNLVDGGNAVEGSNSLDIVQNVMTIGGSTKLYTDTLPTWWGDSSVQNMDFYRQNYPNDKPFAYTLSINGPLVYCTPSTSISVNANGKVTSSVIRTYCINEAENKVYQSAVRYLYCDEDFIWLQPSIFTWSSEQPVNGTREAGMAAVSSALLAGTADVPTTTVEPFEPTAEQLQAGYTSADIVEAVNAQTGTLEGIQSFLNQHLPILGQILAAVTGMAANVATLVSDWASLASGPFSWLASWWQTLTGWWNTLLAWLGATPFGTVMGTVISGVQAIPGALQDLGDVVVSGLEGVLEGVLSIPDALAGVLEGILEGVMSIPDALAGMLEGVAELIPQPSGDVGNGTTPIAIPAAGETFKQNLRDKAPFAYIVAFKESFDSIALTFGSNASFYADLEIPYVEEPVTFDAEPWLLYEWNGFTVAYLIRVMVTASLCIGLVMVSYKSVLYALRQ